MFRNNSLSNGVLNMLVARADFEIDLVSLMCFLPIMRKNAANSLANEVGCNQFDALQDAQNSTKKFLFELYDDLDAFDLHKQASHYF